MKELEAEGNKLIAEFMGEEVAPNGKWKSKHNGIADFQYHSSWDWQIPAWSKISHMAQDFVSKSNSDDFKCSQAYYYKLLDKYESAVFADNIGLGFETIIETLKWLSEKQAC